MADVIIIGGGVIGLCSAYYLNQKGYHVTVVDKTDMLDGCSYGNAGYVCPSHFVPLASPGIVRQGLKWMTSSKSPFYVQPSLDMNLIKWGYHFVRSCTKEHVVSSAIPLRDIAFLSMKLYEELNRQEGFNFYFEKKGMLEFFKTEKTRLHEEEMVSKAKSLGIDAKLLDKKEAAEMEPGIEVDILGGIYYSCDGHLNPNELMHCLISFLKKNNVRFVSNEEVTNFITDGKTLKGVKTGASEYTADHFVLASGSWSGELAGKLDLKIPLVGGRGYSITLEDSGFEINHPIILTESKVALTPLGKNKIRIGGTMEITSTSTPPKIGRVKAILESVKKYIPAFDIPLPPIDKIWYGYRPCSADGLPYIGRFRKYENLVIASGHSMVGLSLGAATGKLVSETVHKEPVSINIDPFSPERFS
jgi:D-amino-acid dehydrogenase